MVIEEWRESKTAEITLSIQNDEITVTLQLDFRLVSFQRIIEWRVFLFVCLFLSLIMFFLFSNNDDDNNNLRRQTTNQTLDAHSVDLSGKMRK